MWCSRQGRHRTNQTCMLRSDSSRQSSARQSARPQHSQHGRERGRHTTPHNTAPHLCLAAVADPFCARVRARHAGQRVRVQRAARLRSAVLAGRGGSASAVLAHASTSSSSTISALRSSRSGSSRRRVSRGGSGLGQHPLDADVSQCGLQRVAKLLNDLMRWW